MFGWVLEDVTRRDSELGIVYVSSFLDGWCRNDFPRIVDFIVRRCDLLAFPPDAYEYTSQSAHPILITDFMSGEPKEKTEAAALTI